MVNKHRNLILVVEKRIQQFYSSGFGNSHSVCQFHKITFCRMPALLVGIAFEIVAKQSFVQGKICICNMYFGIHQIVSRAKQIITFYGFQQRKVF